MIPSTRLVLSVCALCLAASPAPGQVPGTVSFEGAFQTVTFRDEFAGIRTGVGFDAAVGYRASPLWMVLAGVARTAHRVTGTDSGVGEEDVATLWRVYAEPRLVFAERADVDRAYVFAVAGYARQTLYALFGDVGAGGLVIGGGVGVQIDTRGPAAITIQGGRMRLVLGDMGVDGRRVPESSRRGAMWFARAGLVVSRHPGAGQ